MEISVHSGHVYLILNSGNFITNNIKGTQKHLSIFDQIHTGVNYKKNIAVEREVVFSRLLLFIFIFLNMYTYQTP